MSIGLWSTISSGTVMVKLRLNYNCAFAALIKLTTIGMLNWLKRIEGLIFTLSSAEVSCGLCWAPRAQAPPRMLCPFLLYVMNFVHDFSGIKGFISRKGCKPLIQIMSFLILLFHILIWNDILIIFSGISKRKKNSFDPLERLIFFS